MVNRQRRVSGLPFRKPRERNRLAFAVHHEHLIERADILGVTWVDFHHHFVLVKRLVDGRNLALAEGVIEQAIGVLHADAKPRHRFAVIDQAHLRAVVLLIGVHVGELRQFRERLADFRLPFAQRRQIVRQQGVLITGVRLPPADADILHRH